MTSAVDFIVARIKEKSTITTIITLIAGVAGAKLSPENTDTIAVAVTAVVSAIAVFWGQDHKTS